MYILSQCVQKYVFRSQFRIAFLDFSLHTTYAWTLANIHKIHFKTLSAPTIP